MRKIISKIMLITMLVVAIVPLTTKAGYQANKGGVSVKTSSSIKANDLFTGIRNMESGTLGSKLDSTEDDMDCHMAKNTEWGTAAMLSASIYGEAPEGISNESTTGNDTGIFQMADGNGNKTTDSKGYELVAGIYKTGNSYTNTIINAGDKYYDSYSSETSKPGDATTETAEWKSASTHNFIKDSTYSIFCRGWQGIFGFCYHDGYCSRDSGTTYYYASARAVVVFGEDL